MTEGIGGETASVSRLQTRQKALAQVTGVGLGFAAALLLAGLFFLATGRGSETDALAVFPLWGIIFVSLIWRATGWRQPVGRGLALLAVEFLVLPLAWLFFQGLPSISERDTRVPQTLSVLAMGVGTAAVLLAGSLFVSRRSGGITPGPKRRILLTVVFVAFIGEVFYGITLLAVSLRS